jgi:hypothetical protein
MTPLIALLALSTPAPAPSSLEFSAEPVVLAPAVADEPMQGAFSYSFIEANYLWTDIDGLDDPLDGWEARISFELPLNIFLQGSYGQVSDDFDLDTWRLGAGWHLPVGQKLDFYGILSVAGQDVEDGENDDGVAAEIGGRFLLGNRMEVNARGQWMDVEEDSEAGVGIGGRFYFTPKLSGGVNADFLEERELYAIGLRYQF